MDENVDNYSKRQLTFSETKVYGRIVQYQSPRRQSKQAENLCIKGLPCHVLIPTHDHLHGVPIHHFHFKGIIGSSDSSHGSNATSYCMLRLWKVL